MKKLAVLALLGLVLAAGLTTTFSLASSVSAGQQQEKRKPP